MGANVRRSRERTRIVLLTAGRAGSAAWRRVRARMQITRLPARQFWGAMAVAAAASTSVMGSVLTYMSRTPLARE